MRRPALVAAMVVAVLAVLIGVAAPATAASGPARGAVVATRPAQSEPDADPATDPDGDPSTDDAPVPGGDIIPDPNSGQAPDDVGDRGGALQLGLLAVMVTGIGLIVTMIVRESRRSRARAEERPAGSDGAPVGGADLPGRGPEPQSSGAYSSQPR